MFAGLDRAARPSGRTPHGGARVNVTVQDDPQTGSEAETSGLVMLSFVALVGGAGAGLLGALFRLALEHGDRIRNAAIVAAHAVPGGIAFVVAATAAASALAASLVRRFSPRRSSRASSRPRRCC